MARRDPSGTEERRKASGRAVATGVSSRRSGVDGTVRGEPSEAAAGSKPRHRTSEPGPSERRELAAGLYLVATPIGNLRDITLRALDVLRDADVVACEDTRITGRLLRAYGIATPMTPYHEHNAARARPALLDRIRTGAAVALVSDAGTPLISDPGYKLVRAAVAEGFAVTALPGPAAPLAALIGSGLPTDRFLFAGFLPPREAARRKTLSELVALRASLVFFESPRRLAASLADMAAVLGPREAAVARELTKLYEELRRGRLDALAAEMAASEPPRGEIVVVVGPPDAEASGSVEPADAAPDLDDRLRATLAAASLRDAVAAVSRETGLPRRVVYARALALQGGR